jgi:hypothetical protein
MTGKLRPALRVVFWTAAVAILVLAIGPAQGVPGASDKHLHFGAFFVLAALAAGAYPERRPSFIWVSLVAYGAAIELVQGTALVGRDADVVDWVTDALGALTSLAVLSWVRRRRRRGRRHAPPRGCLRAKGARQTSWRGVRSEFPGGCGGA